MGIVKGKCFTMSTYSVQEVDCMFFTSSKYRKAFFKSMLFVLPGVAITVIFVIYPVINTFCLNSR